jgi:hypothetical protein
MDEIAEKDKEAAHSPFVRVSTTSSRNMGELIIISTLGVSRSLVVVPRKY